jgi:hypothetical protein
MKSMILVVVILGMLIIGGAATYLISSSGVNIIVAGDSKSGHNEEAVSISAVRSQTSNPEASALMATPTQGALFFIWTGIVLGNVVGIGLTITGIMWVLNRGVTRAKLAEKNNFSFSLSASKPNSLGAVVAKRPAVTIGLIVFLLASIAIFLAAIGAFNV